MSGSKRQQSASSGGAIDRLDVRVGARLKSLREGKGWSQSHLATVVNESAGFGWHQTTVGKVESGERPMRLAEAAAVARIFYVTVDQLVQGTGGLEHQIDVVLARDFELLRILDFIVERRANLQDEQGSLQEQLGRKLGDGESGQEA